MTDYRTQELLSLIRSIDNDLSALIESVADLATLGRDIEFDNQLAAMAGDQPTKE